METTGGGINQLKPSVTGHPFQIKGPARLHSPEEPPVAVLNSARTITRGFETEDRIDVLEENGPNGRGGVVRDSV